MNNSLAVTTMIRNRLINENHSLSDKMTFFHEKGVTMLMDGNYIFLKTDRRGHISELSDICNGLIYRDKYLLCFHGKETKTMSLSEARENFIWNSNTVLMDYFPDGVVNYLFWDYVAENWQVSDEKQPISPYSIIIKEQVYNIMALDPRYTYELSLVQTGDEAGLYLMGAYDNRSLKELPWNKVDPIAGRHKLLRPTLYAFTKFDDIEENELPLLVQDQSLSKIIINAL